MYTHTYIYIHILTCINTHMTVVTARSPRDSLLSVIANFSSSSVATCGHLAIVTTQSISKSFKQISTCCDFPQRARAYFSGRQAVCT